MSANSRIRELTPGVVAEKIAIVTTINYDAATEGARINFDLREVLYVNGAYTPMEGSHEVMGVMLSDILTRTDFAEGLFDPVTGESLDGVLTPAGVAAYLKRVVDVLHNERFAPQGE